MTGELAEMFLMVSDLQETVEFYEKTIGLDVIKRGNEVRFDTGAATLVVEEDFDEEILAEFGLEPPGDDRGDGAIVVVDVDDPDAIYERAEDRGADTILEPRNVEWGRRMALVADPDGYVLEVSKPLEE